jgi:hypothetical protein
MSREEGKNKASNVGKVDGMIMRYKEPRGR